MVHESAVWRCRIMIAKFWGDIDPDFPGNTPYEVIEQEGNLLMYGGVSNLWEALIGNGTGTAGQTLTHFNNANAAIGVGNSNTASAATQTNLQGASRLRKAMDVSFPTHTSGTTSTNAAIQFRSTFATSDANFAWEEAGVFNSATDGVGRMLNRRVQSMGTKTSTSSWQITFDITIS